RHPRAKKSSSRFNKFHDSCEKPGMALREFPIFRPRTGFLPGSPLATRHSPLTLLESALTENWGWVRIMLTSNPCPSRLQLVGCLSLLSAIEYTASSFERRIRWRCRHRHYKDRAEPARHVVPSHGGTACRIASPQKLRVSQLSFRRPCRPTPTSKKSSTPMTNGPAPAPAFANATSPPPAWPARTWLRKPPSCSCKKPTPIPPKSISSSWPASR